MKSIDNKELFDFIWESNNRGECKETIERIVRIEIETSNQISALEKQVDNNSEHLLSIIRDYRNDAGEELRRFAAEMREQLDDADCKYMGIIAELESRLAKVEGSGKKFGR